MQFDRHPFFCLITLNVYFLADCMEQSDSSEVNLFAISQVILRVVWSTMVHYRIHKCTWIVPIRSQLNPVHPTTSQYQKFRHVFSYTSNPGSPKWWLFLKFRQWNTVYNSTEEHNNNADTNSAEVWWHLIPHTNGNFSRWLTNYQLQAEYGNTK